MAEEIQKIIVLDMSAAPVGGVDTDTFALRAMFVYPIDQLIVIKGQQVTPKGIFSIDTGEPHLIYLGLLNSVTRQGIIDGALFWEIISIQRQPGETEKHLFDNVIAEWNRRRAQVQIEVHRIWDRYGWNVDPDTEEVTDANGNPVVLEE